MKLRTILIGAVIAIGSGILLAQDEAQPQLTPRTAPETQSATQVPPTAVTPAAAGDRVGETTTPTPAAAASQKGTASEFLTVPAGTKIPLTLKQGITTKNAKPGDPVYAQTAFPITQNDHIVIPAGTFVQGEIRSVQRPGRVKGRASLLMNFTSMIFPNGYTIVLPGAVQGTPGDAGTNGVKDKEGTIAGDSSKGKDVGTVVGTAIPGAGIGAIADQGNWKGATVGALSGGALGLATVLLTRGPEIQLGVGESIEMVLERTLNIDPGEVNRAQ